jgi:hypothetical protein
MSPAELDLLRSLINSLIHTASAIDQLMNPEGESEPEPPRRIPRVLEDDEPKKGA